MERKEYAFCSNGSEKLNGTIQYQGWFAEEDMITFAHGLVVGLKVYCKTADVRVYEVVDGTWHLVRIQE